jgi:hypothetical protein
VLKVHQHKKRKPGKPPVISKVKSTHVLRCCMNVATKELKWVHNTVLTNNPNTSYVVFARDYVDHTGASRPINYHESIINPSDNWRQVFCIRLCRDVGEYGQPKGFGLYARDDECLCQSVDAHIDITPYKRFIQIPEGYCIPFFGGEVFTHEEFEGRISEYAIYTVGGLQAHGDSIACCSPIPFWICRTNSCTTTLAIGHWPRL